jgi:hypothetical protein
MTMKELALDRVNNGKVVEENFYGGHRACLGFSP